MPKKEFNYPKHLGERIRSARLNLGLNQEQLADEVGLPRPAISQIESGKRAIDSMELVAFSKALREPLSFFLEPLYEEGEEEPVKVLYRSDDISERDKSTVDDFLVLAKDYTMLEKLLGLNLSQPLPSWGTEIKTKWDAIVDGQKTAEALRGVLNLGLAPVKELDKVLESAGIKVVMRAIPDSKVWGFSLSSKALGHCIFANTYCVRERQNFTLAHELGHLVMDRNHSATVLTAKEAQQLNDDLKVLIEIRANSFAAAFLMPEAAIEHALAKLGMSRRTTEQLTTVTIEYLRNHFGVSYDAMLWRLINLKWISKQDRQKFVFQLEEEKGETASSSPKESLPERYRNLAFKAYQSAKISIGKLAELLRIDVYEARKLVKEFRIQQIPA